MEVTYTTIKHKTKKEQAMEIKEMWVLEKEPEEKEIYSSLDKTLAIAPMKAEKIVDISKITEPSSKVDKSLLNIDPFRNSVQVHLPSLQTEKITNPQYLTYNQRIRQKIKQRAYEFIQKENFEEGEVYVTFSLTRDGQLKEIRIIDEKTQANESLRSISLRSVQGSNPFPPFPKDLLYPDLTFNVIISFRE